jgi:alpha-L-fucosidase
VLSRLVRVVSLGGNYMLNIGPTGRGVIPEASAEILRRAGDWLKCNGEAVYNTGRSPIPAQAWGVCTTAPGKLFLHVLNWPTSGKLIVPGIRAKIKNCTLLATGKKLPVSFAKGNLVINIPLLQPENPITVLALQIAGSLSAQAGMFCIYPDLPNRLHAPFAKLAGCTLKKLRWMEKFGDWHHAEVAHEIKNGSIVEWRFNALDKGLFNVLLEYDCMPDGDDSELELSVGESKFAFPVFCTGNRHANRRRFRTENLGVIVIAKSGQATLRIKALNCHGENALSVAGVTLEPVR